MKDMKKKVMAVLGGAVLVSAGIAGGFALDNPDTIVKEVPVEVIKQVNNTIEVPVEVIKEVPYYVDNGKLDMVLNYLEDKNIFDDAKEIVRNIELEDEALKMVLDEITTNFADYSEDEGLFNDENKLGILKIYSGVDDYVLLESDYDDNEFLFKVMVKINDDDKDAKSKVWFEVSVEDGEASIENAYFA